VQEQLELADDHRVMTRPAHWPSAKPSAPDNPQQHP
jgi:hypothetical protein